MSIAAIVLGCIAILLYLMSRLPFMRLVDLLTIPVAIVGIIIGAIALGTGGALGLTIIGLILSIMALIFGWDRLVGRTPLGGGRAV